MKVISKSKTQPSKEVLFFLLKNEFSLLIPLTAEHFMATLLLGLLSRSTPRREEVPPFFAR